MLLFELEAQNVQTHRSRFSETFTIEVGGIKSKTTVEGHKIVCTLPSAARVQASFTKEGMFQKVVKVFKREIQTGDETFDSAIYIDCAVGVDILSEILQDASIRDALFGIVTTGGQVTVSGNQIEWRIASDDIPEAELASFVQRVLA